MKYVIFSFQLIVSFFGFTICYLFSAIIGGYTVEYNNNPSEFDKIIYAFHHSYYPYIALLFLLWMTIVVIIFDQKKQS